MSVGTVAQEVDGQTYRFPKLTRRECIDLAQKAFDDGRDKLIKDLADSNAAPELKETKLAAYRVLEGSHELLLRMVKSLAGSTDIINLSAGKMNGSRPNLERVFDMPLNDVMVLAAQIVGFRVSDKPAAGESDDNDGFDYSKDRPTPRNVG